MVRVMVSEVLSRTRRSHAWPVVSGASSGPSKIGQHGWLSASAGIARRETVARSERATRA
eukprot:1147024-Pyramimonas_sp.AAC.1